MEYKSYRQELLQMQMSGVVSALDASTRPVVIQYKTSEGKKRGVAIRPQNLCKLSLVLMSNVAWENLGIDVKDHACVGLFFEGDNVLHCAVVDGEFVRIVKPCFPFRSELERVEAGTFIHSNPSWANVKNSQSLILTIVLNCLAKYALENLVQRLFLPWGSVPLGSDPKI
jgi:hypothetical protein